MRPDGADDDAAARVDADGRTLFVPFGARVDYFLELPPEASFGFEALRSADDAAFLELVLQPHGGEERSLARLGSGGGARRIPLPSAPERIVRLSLLAGGAAHPAPGAGVSIVAPAVVVRLPRGRSEPPPQPARQAPGPPRRPNILVYLVDTLRADHLGCYGYPRPVSPHIDAFAQDATVFDNALAQSPWTRPSTASLFTGLCPSAHRLNGRRHKLSRGAETLAELLRDAGYATAAFVANAQISRQFGFDQGFDEFVLMPAIDADPVALHAAHEAATAHEASDALHERVHAWLEEKGHRQPFFLYVHTLDPHVPYAPTEKFRARFAGDVAEPPLTPESQRHLASRRERLVERGAGGSDLATNLGSVIFMAALEAGQLPVTDGLVGDLIALYDAEIAMNDEKFGGLMADLEQRGLYDDALIVFLADHGEEFAEHEYWGHSRSVYGGAVDIPLIVKWPAGEVDAPKRTPVLAQQIDVLPTILDYLGLETPDHVEGRSLLARIREAALPPPGFSFFEHRGWRGAAMTRGPWKLVVNWRPDAYTRLYRRDLDPGEEQDVLDENPVMAGYLRSLMRAHEHGEATLEAEEATLDPALLERLRGLGYVH